jgi:hypothetical protein
MYRIETGIIKSYDDDNPKICNVLQMPNGYMMRNMQLPNTLNNQIKPKKGSLVLVAIVDSYQGYIIAHLRDPGDFLNKGRGTRGAKLEEKDDLFEGEVYLEAAGDPSSPFSGTGPSLHLANDGTATIASGKLKEYIIVGGEEGDDDNEIIVNADNVTIKSNMDSGETIESNMRFDEDNLIEIGNYFKPLPDRTGTLSDIVEIPVGELKIEKKLTGQHITLHNQTLAGTPLCSLEMTPTGSLSTSSLLSTNIDATTSISLSATTTLSLNSTLSTSIDALTSMSISAGTTLDISSNLAMSLDGLTINLNSGTFGVARLNDIVTSDMTTDPAWWLWWQLLSALIEALPVTPLDGGATFKEGLAGLFATIPTTIISKITSASTTVKAGG